MKPFNPYQGPAPAAMAQMGQGILEAGANIGRITQAGYESMGKGLAGGINMAVGEYAKYKDTQSQVKASEKSYETLKSYLPEEVRNQFDTQIQSMNQSDSTSLRDKAAFWDQAKSFIGSAVGQTFQMQKQQQEINSSMALQQQRDAAARERELLGIQARAEEFGGAGAPVDGTAMPGAPFYDQGLQGAQPQPNPFGSLIKKRHFGGR